MLCERPEGRSVESRAHDGAAARENRGPEVADDATNMKERHHVHYSTSQLNGTVAGLKKTYY